MRFPPNSRLSNLDRFHKLSILALIILSLSLGWEAFATPAPGRNTVVTPGTDSKLCTFTAYVDGSTYLLNDNTGDNIDHDTDFGALVRRNAGVSISFCLETGTYTVSSSIVAGGVTMGIGLSDQEAIIATGGNVIVKAAANLALGNSGTIISNIGGTSTGNNNITISQLTIDGNKANRPAEKSACLSLAGSGSDYKVLNSDLLNCPGPGLNLTAKRSTAHDIRIIGASTLATGSPGFYLTDTSDSIFSNFFISGSGWRGIHALGLQNDTFNGFVIANSGDTGIEISSGVVLTTTKFNTFTNIVTRGNANYGFWVASTSVSDLVLNNVQAISNGNGGFQLANGVRRMVATNIIAEYNKQDGIAIANGGGQDAQNVALSNCLSLDNRQQGSGTFNGLSISGAEFVIVSNCRIFDDQVSPTQTTSIRLFSICNNVTIINNDLRGPVSISKITIDPTNMNLTIRNNPGYNPLGKIGSPFGLIGNQATGGIGLGLSSTSANPSANKDYIIVTLDEFLTCTGGTGVAIVIKDAGGNAITTAVATIQYQFIPIGYVVNFGGFSVTPTCTLDAN